MPLSSLLQDSIYSLLPRVGDATNCIKDSNDVCLPNSQTNINNLLNQPILPSIQSRISYTDKMYYLAFIFVFGLIGIIASFMFYTKIFYVKNKTNPNKINDNMNTYANKSYTNSSPNDYRITQPIAPMTSHVRFNDVAGIRQAKDELLEIIDYLKNPKKYQDLGIHLPKGVLLSGPPGVGKTMIAKAVAGEAGVPFFYQSGSSFVEMYVGIGAQRVRDLFARARVSAPAIIFIDEIDAIGKMRGIDNHQEWESTLNELLTQMDGFEQQSGIIVIAATNQVENIDSALVRSGRFDRRIFVDLPDIKEREEILKVYLKGRKHNVNLAEIAKLCVGFSGADIMSLVNEAALYALRDKRDSITTDDIIAASDKIIFGTKKQIALSESQKKIIAIYNAGKAISQYWLLQDFEKISLITYSNAQNLTKIPECALKSEMITYIRVALSGNIALEIEGLESANISKQDLQEAKNIAMTMCKDYGMGVTITGTQDDVLDILTQAYNEHKSFLQLYKQYIPIIANELLDKERLDKDDIQRILLV
ncbi:AAA family ATPase [Helicobacter muridarum]|nr:AAA family ATPase [Helicobacter muridarum]